MKEYVNIKLPAEDIELLIKTLENMENQSDDIAYINACWYHAQDIKEALHYIQLGYPQD